VGGLELADLDSLPAAVQPDRVSAPRGATGAPSDPGELERRLDYRFKDRLLLREALTHGSASGPGRGRRRTNERLEFLGDRVVGLAVAELLIRRYPDEPEGALSPRLSGLVSEPALAAVARTLGLGAWLVVARSEEEAGGRERPAILADAFEALIGAVYLDGGWDRAAAIVRRGVEPLLETMVAPPRDAKSRLQEWTQARSLGLPRYELVQAEGPDHAPIFEVAVAVADLPPARAAAQSKRAAEQAAAAALLARLEGAGATDG
jgi:ribonuclease-3